MSIVHAPIGAVGDSLTILDAERRLYAGLSREGDYWHVIEPLQVALVDGDGNVIRPVGELACRCKGATYHAGTCYRANQAIAFEAGDAGQATHALTPPSWHAPDPRAALEAGAAVFDAPVGAGDAVESYRG